MSDLTRSWKGRLSAAPKKVTKRWRCSTCQGFNFADMLKCQFCRAPIHSSQLAKLASNTEELR